MRGNMFISNMSYISYCW